VAEDAAALPRGARHLIRAPLRALGALLGLLAALACARTAPQELPPPPPPGDDAVAVGTHGAVASAEANASRVGIEVLRKGGNAVDAAVAIAFALGVTHPSAGNIGGGGFLLLRLADGRTRALDYRERAPGAASRDMYLGPDGKPDARSRVGALAAGIPGDVAGLAWAHAEHGTRPWAELIEPAIELAEDGWELDPFHAADLAGAAAAMRAAGFKESAALFERPDGTPIAPGERWRQPELARTLQEIARGGPDAFYRGPLAQRMVREVQALGGIWTLEDLASYRALERTPISFEYRGYEIHSMPPPSAGGLVLRQILAGAEALELERLPWSSPLRAHLYVETLRRAYLDRNHRIGDPDFVRVPLAELLDPAYGAARVRDIDPDHATPSSALDPGPPGLSESRETTHFSVVDARGMAVANTFTLNGGFGAKRVIPGTGVILNNEMDDFTAKVGAPNMFGLVQGEQNAIAPGKRMLSSMTPTIITRGGALRAVLGSPGGPTITTTVAQIAMQLIDYGRTLPDAVREPRIHHQGLPDAVIAEEAVDPGVVEGLRARGHNVILRPSIGHANCVEVDPQSGALRAVADVTRDGGKALAY
jgi:gamma-glutamyltranspeptidase/glutathione hydrolase